MGRGTRANRLGDHHSSDGEHEADGEHEVGSCCGGEDEESGEELGRGKKGVVDEELARVEREEKSVMGSVY